MLNNYEIQIIIVLVRIIDLCDVSFEKCDPKLFALRSAVH